MIHLNHPEGVAQISAIGRSPKARGAVRKTSRSTVNKLAVALLLVLHSGIPFAAIGLPAYYGAQLAAIVIVASVILATTKLALNARPLDDWGAGIIAFVLYCIFVSLFSNFLLFPQSLSGWVPGLYAIVPALVIFTFRLIGASVEDVIDGVVLAALFGAVLISLDRAVPIYFLDSFTRHAVADPTLRRVVLLKNEMALAFVILVARSTAFPRSRLFLNLGMLATIGYALFVVSESRLAIAATVIGIFIYVLAFPPKGRRLPAILITAACLAFATPFVFNKYISYVRNTADFSINDESVRFRLVEKRHFETYFDQTYGLGFGIMSTGAEKTNLLAFSASGAAALYGYNRQPMGLADLGYLGALYQFGYVGLASAIFLTFVTARALWRSGKKCGYRMRYDLGALAALLIGFQLSPLPTNFFTLDWSVMIGGILWFVAAESSREAGFARRLPSGYSVHSILRKSIPVKIVG